MKKGRLKTFALLFLIAIISGILGILYASQQKPKYESKLTFALDEGTGGGAGGVLNLAAQFGLNIGGGKDVFAGDNILEIIKSRRMIERVFLSIDTFGKQPYTLIEYFLQRCKINNLKISSVHFPIGQDKSSFNYRQDSVLYVTYLEFVDSYIYADKPDRKLGIFEVRITSPDEKFTKDFTDRLVAETNSFYIEIRSNKAKETLDVLEKRVSTMKGDLNTSLSNRAAVQDININPAFSAAQVPVLKQQANIQVYSGAYGEMFKNLELARFQYLNEIPLMQIIDPADYPMKKIKESRLKTALLFSVLSLLITILIMWAIGRKANHKMSL